MDEKNETTKDQDNIEKTDAEKDAIQVDTNPEAALAKSIHKSSKDDLKNIEAVKDDSVSSTTNSDNSGLSSDKSDSGALSAVCAKSEDLDVISNSVSLRNFLSSNDGDEKSDCGSVDEKVDEWTKKNLSGTPNSSFKDSDQYKELENEMRNLESIRSIIGDHNDAETDSTAKLNLPILNLVKSPEKVDDSEAKPDEKDAQSIEVEKKTDNEVKEEVVKVPECDQQNQDENLVNKDSVTCETMEKDEWSDSDKEEKPEEKQMSDADWSDSDKEEKKAEKKMSDADWPDEENVTRPPKTDSPVQMRPRNNIRPPTKLNNQRNLDGNNNAAEIDQLVRSFDKFNLKDDLMNVIKSLKLNHLNKLQENILAKLKSNQETGIFIKTTMYSNKELMYLVSAFDRIDKTLKKTQVVIVLPIAEMVDKVYQAALPIADKLGITVRNFTAGKLQGSQYNDHLIVTTLKVLDWALLRKRIVDRTALKAIIFDEFDMLINFKENPDTIHNIISATECQRIFFSSSLQDKVLDFVQKHSKNNNNNKLTILDLFNKNEVFKNIVHFIVLCEERQNKKDAVVKVINNTIVDKVLIFASNKTIVNDISSLIKSKTNVKEQDCQMLSVGEAKKYNERSNLVYEFKDQKKGILICQYPLGINLEFGEVSMVINYDLPPLPKDNIREYYHRIAILGQSKKPSFVVSLVKPNYFNMVKSTLQDHYHIKMRDLKLED